MGKKGEKTILANISFFVSWLFWVKCGTNRLLSSRGVEWAHALNNLTTSKKVMIGKV